MAGFLRIIVLALANASEGYPLDPSCLEERMDPPLFPAEEFRRAIHGVVILEIDAEPCGKVHDVRVVSSSGNRNLDAAAVKRARKWDMPARIVSTMEMESVRWTVQITFPTPSDNPALGLQGNYQSTTVVVSAPVPINVTPEGAARKAD